MKPLLSAHNLRKVYALTYRDHMNRRQVAIEGLPIINGEVVRSIEKVGDRRFVISFVSNKRSLTVDKKMLIAQPQIVGWKTKE